MSECNQTSFLADYLQLLLAAGVLLCVYLWLSVFWIGVFLSGCLDGSLSLQLLADLTVFLDSVMSLWMCAFLSAYPYGGVLLAMCLSGSMYLWSFVFSAACHS